jgi:hypothetical protein
VSADRAEVDRVARLLMAEWERVEEKPVGVSYVATFADLARVVIRDRQAAEAAAWDQGLVAAGESLKALYDGSGSWAKQVNPYRAVVEERNPYLPEAPEDGKHIFPGGSYRCSRCGVYNRTDSPPFHEPCKGAWAESGKMRYAAEEKWATEREREAT